MSETSFSVGQRVTLSPVGRKSLKPITRNVITGVVSKTKQLHPDAVAVLIDGAARPLQYNQAYWAPMN